MSTTPRTDAEQKRQEGWADEVHADTYDCWIETFKFARQLELENTKLQKELLESRKMQADRTTERDRALADRYKWEETTSKLIEVARAAKSDKRNNDCTCYSDPERSCRYCGYFIRLDQALKSLEESGVKI